MNFCSFEYLFRLFSYCIAFLCYYFINSKSKYIWSDGNRSNSLLATQLKRTVLIKAPS